MVQIIDCTRSHYKVLYCNCFFSALVCKILPRSTCNYHCLHWCPISNFHASTAYAQRSL